MKVSGSANAKAIEEYMRQDTLRFIFLKALPRLKASDYKTMPRSHTSTNTFQGSKNDLYKHKIA
jgi:hypothetical protein